MKYEKSITKLKDNLGYNIFYYNNFSNELKKKKKKKK